MAERKVRTEPGKISSTRLLGILGLDRPTLFREVLPLLSFPLDQDRRGMIPVNRAEEISHLVENLREQGLLQPRRKISPT